MWAFSTIDIQKSPSWWRSFRCTTFPLGCIRIIIAIRSSLSRSLTEKRACGIGVIPNHNYQRLKEFNLRRIYEAELGTDQVPCQVGQVHQPIHNGVISPMGMLQVTEKSGAEISTPPNQPEPKDQLEKSDVEEKEPAATSQQESST